MARKAGIFIDHDHGTYSRTALRHLKKKDALEIMEAWFRHRYEDPVHRTPYESSEGGYQYVHGGPYDASEQLGDQFYDLFPEKWLNETVAELENESFLWTETPNDDDSEEGSDEHLPLQIGSEEELDLRKHLLQRIERLEQLLAERPAPHGMMGHNNPPEEVSEDDALALDALAESVTQVRTEIEKAQPSPAVVASNYETATTLQERLQAVALKKLDLATDEFAKGFGGELGKSLGKLAFWGPVLGALAGALSWLESWLQAVGVL